jgi:hypothetical protein
VLEKMAAPTVVAAMDGSDRVFFEPGENHWHGAAPGRFMAHVAIHQNDESGSPVTWGELVTDEQYAAAPPTQLILNACFTSPTDATRKASHLRR